jgi:hypothetical protein
VRSEEEDEEPDDWEEEDEEPDDWGEEESKASESSLAQKWRRWRLRIRRPAMP